MTGQEMRSLEALCRMAVKHLDAASLEIKQLKAQLLEGMQHCTIRFIECPVGHGRLSADNWIDNGCPTCERNVANTLLKRANSPDREWTTAYKAYLAAQPGQLTDDDFDLQAGGLGLSMEEVKERYPDQVQYDGDSWEDRAHQAEALHADMCEQARQLRLELDDAWKAANTGARGLTTLADVIATKLERSEAEQRVLDAVRDIPESEIRYGCRNWMGYAKKVAVAEFTRRGLK